MPDITALNKAVPQKQASEARIYAKQELLSEFDPPNSAVSQEEQSSPSKRWLWLSVCAYSVLILVASVVI